ncbi:rhodanese-like domain-containing protein [Kocuria sp. CPCC 205235]|uniref:rhodanese-like domain-containing protein n=1 Tax=Kocuria sp. CPCC 205235 TaxID=3073549 RepID=UPI0034D416BA
MTAPELADLLAARERGGTDFELVDVREPYEARLASIPGAWLLPLDRFESWEALARIAPGRRVVLHCKAGARSEGPCTSCAPRAAPPSRTSRAGCWRGARRWTRPTFHTLAPHVRHSTLDEQPIP